MVPENQGVGKSHFWPFFDELKMFFQSPLLLGTQNITAIDTEKWLFWAKIGPETAKSEYLIKNEVRGATDTLGQGDEGVSKDGRRVVRYSLHQVVDHCIDSKAGDRFDARLVGDVFAVGVDGVDRDA